MKRLTYYEIAIAAQIVAAQIKHHFGDGKVPRCYPVPRGGVPAALAVARYYDLIMVDNPAYADLIIDDLVSTGRTLSKFADLGKPCFVLFDKQNDERYKQQWLVFPWEGSEEASFDDHIVRILEFVGEDPKRGGLLETPARVVKAWKHWCSGYEKKPEEILKVFEDGAEAYDQMITVKDIPIYSHCEHHLAPIFGTATISYIPNGKIVGLSKLSRLADMFARRLQVQERLTSQIANALQEHLAPKGVGVCIKARHLCMESRGVCQQGHQTITTALTGAILTEDSTRAEFLRFAV